MFFISFPIRNNTRVNTQQYAGEYAIILNDTPKNPRTESTTVGKCTRLWCESPFRLHKIGVEMKKEKKNFLGTNNFFF